MVRTGKTKYGSVYICGNMEETSEIISDFARHYAKAFPKAIVRLYSGESFIDEYLIQARNGETLPPSKEFGAIDLLIFEKADLINGYNNNMVRLFSAFDITTERGGSVIFTSEMLPGEMGELAPRNRAQFEGGLIINLRN